MIPGGNHAVAATPPPPATTTTTTTTQKLIKRIIRDSKPRKVTPEQFQEDTQAWSDPESVSAHPDIDDTNDPTEHDPLAEQQQHLLALDAVSAASVHIEAEDLEALAVGDEPEALIIDHDVADTVSGISGAENDAAGFASFGVFKFWHTLRTAESRFKFFHDHLPIFAKSR